VFEKLQACTDKYNWTSDKILIVVSIYFASKARPATAQHIDFEKSHRQPPPSKQAANYINVKLSVLLFPKEIVLLPTRWHKTLSLLVFKRRHEEGGYSASWKRPNALAIGSTRYF
jgi:hypothetical protein